MADTGFVFPGTAAGNRASAGNADWTNPDEIKASDATDTFVAIGGDWTSNGLAASNFDFSSIPVDSAIDGIEIQVGSYEKTGGTVTFIECSLILADDSDGSVSKHADLAVPITSLQTDEAGGAADLWDETISRANVQDADWGFFVRGGGTSFDFLRIDFLQMKVYYTEPGPEPTIGSLTITGLLPLIPPSITSVNADVAWADGDTDLEIVGTNLI